MHVWPTEPEHVHGCHRGWGVLAMSAASIRHLTYTTGIHSRCVQSWAAISQARTQSPEALGVQVHDGSGVVRLCLAGSRPVSRERDLCAEQARHAEVSPSTVLACVKRLSRLERVARLTPVQLGRLVNCAYKWSGSESMSESLVSVRVKGKFKPGAL